MRTQALKKAQQKYYEKMKDNEEYRQKRNENMKNYYNRNKDNPEFKQKINQRSLDYYYKNRDSILAKKKESYVKVSSKVSPE